MNTSYYEQELARLREEGGLFAKAHPALAPLLSSEAADPDVERILEGTAFLSGCIREKLEDELPEVIHTLLWHLAPHYLRSIPSMTMMEFTPRRSLRETIRVPRGTQLASRPIDSTACLFSTTADVWLSPLTLEDAVFTPQGRHTGRLVLSFASSDLLLAELDLDHLSLTCKGAYAEAAENFRVLMECTREVLVVPQSGGSSLRLPPSCLSRNGFGPEEAILPFSPAAFPAFRHIQEYFSMPERFCSARITGLGAWKDRGEGKSFRLEFSLTNLPENFAGLTLRQLGLYVTPAVNLFAMDATPITLDQTRFAYPVLPDGEAGHYRVYSVDSVSGLRQGDSAERTYRPFLGVNPSTQREAVYSLSHRPSPSGTDRDIWLSVGYSKGEIPVSEVLSVRITASNGRLTEKINIGDICESTSSSPELATFTNLRAPTSPVDPPMGSSILWRLISHLYLNYLSVASAENLRSLLKLYIFPGTRDRAGVVANISRADGVENLVTRSARRFVNEDLMQGLALRLTLKRENFAGLGDMYIFSSVLDMFLSCYASINCYTQLDVEDTTGATLFHWNESLGGRPLL